MGLIKVDIETALDDMIHLGMKMNPVIHDTILDKRADLLNDRIHVSDDQNETTFTIFDNHEFDNIRILPNHFYDEMNEDDYWMVEVFNEWIEVLELEVTYNLYDNKIILKGFMRDNRFMKTECIHEIFDHDGSLRSFSNDVFTIEQLAHRYLDLSL